jgi:dUTP pyrophosphatase
VNINYIKLRESAVEPFSAKDGDAGYDLYAVTREKIGPMERKLIHIGIALEIPDGYYGRIAPRSGLAVRKGIDVMAGVIDSSYRGEVMVLLSNFNPLVEDHAFGGMFGSSNDFIVNPGDRIAQLIIEKCHRVEWDLKEELSDSDRGEGGFGSTGVTSTR